MIQLNRHSANLTCGKWYFRKIAFEKKGIKKKRKDPLVDKDEENHQWIKCDWNINYYIVYFYLFENYNKDNNNYNNFNPYKFYKMNENNIWSEPPFTHEDLQFITQITLDQA